MDSSQLLFLDSERYYSDGQLCNLLSEHKMACGLKDLLKGVVGETTFSFITVKLSIVL